MNEVSIDRGQAHSTQYVWYVIVLLAAVNVFNYMDRMALAVLMPSIKVDLRLSDAQLGLLVGFAFSVFYAICGIPIARWADRGIRRNIIAAALATWSVMTALTGIAQNFWHLFMARVGIGVGEAGCLPPAQSMICDYVPLERRAGVFAFHSFGLFIGMMAGMALAGWLGETIGWRWTFLTLGLPGIAFAALVRLTLREPRRGFFDTSRDTAVNSSFGGTLSFLWSCRTYKLLTCYEVLNGFVQYGLYQWLPSFYVRVFGLSLASVGVHLGIAIGAGSGIGLLIGGLLANKAARRDVRLPLIVGGAATAMALPVILGALFAPSALSSILLVSLTSLLWCVPAGAITATVYSVVMPWMRATTGSINIFVTSVLGFGLGPFCVGFLSDLLASSFGGESLRYALLAPVCLLPVMVIALYVATRNLRDDLLMVGTRLEDRS